MIQTEVQRPVSTAPLALVLTGLSLALLVVSACANAVDARLIEGVPVWSKPMKFAASFMVLFATIAWLETRLSQAARAGWLRRVTIAVMGTAMIAEMGYIMLQAGNAEASHFNYSSPFHTFMYTVVMFVGALALVACVGVYGWIAARDQHANLSPALRRGVSWGFGLSFVLTAIIGTYIGGNNASLVGTLPDEPSWMLLTGWSLDVGDLRPAHFMALHAMQALPLAAVLTTRVSPKLAVYAVTWTAVGYTAVTLLLFGQALTGTPVLRL